MFKNLKSCRKRIIAAVSAAVIAFSSATYFQMHDVSIVQAANGEYRTWKQSDPRWGSIRLGGSSETISQSGCAVTSVAMLLVKAGYFDALNMPVGQNEIPSYFTEAYAALETENRNIFGVRTA